MSYFNNPSVSPLQYQYSAPGPPGAVNYHHTQTQPIIHPTLPASPYHNRLSSYPVDYRHPPTPIPYQYWTRRHTDVASPPNIIPSPPIHNNYIHHSEIKCTGTQQSSSDNNWPMIVQKHQPGSGMVVTATDMFRMKATGHGISITPQQTPSSKQSTPSPQSTKTNVFTTTLESSAIKDANIIKKIDKFVAPDEYCYSQKWTEQNNKPNDTIINKSVTSTLYKSTSSSFVNKNPVVAKPSKTDLFFERAWKLGIQCSNPKIQSIEEPKALKTAGKYSNSEPNNTPEEHLNNDPNVNVEEQNVLNSESDIDSVLRQVAKQLTKDVLCSAIIEINLDYGITVSIGDLGFDVENEVQIVEQLTKIEDDDRVDSNEKLTSSLTSSQTSLLNPDTPEFKPISVEIADPSDCFASSYLPFQTIPISPEYQEDEDYNENNFYASMDCADYACRNADVIEVRPYSDELVDCETQTTETCSLEVGVNTINYESKTCASQTEDFKCKTKNRKLQTSPELSLCYNKEIVSDSSYRYMKVLEKEVYSLRSQMCSSELQRELHELHYSKTHWSNFFNPQCKEKTGLEDLCEARMQWLQQCIANLQCQLEEGLRRLDKGENLKDLPVLSIYIPTSSGNASYLPKSVMNYSDLQYPSSVVENKNTESEVEISVSKKDVDGLRKVESVDNNTQTEICLDEKCDNNTQTDIDISITDMHSSTCSNSSQESSEKNTILSDDAKETPERTEDSSPVESVKNDTMALKAIGTKRHHPTENSLKDQDRYSKVKRKLVNKSDRVSSPQLVTIDETPEIVCEENFQQDSNISDSLIEHTLEDSEDIDTMPETDLQENVLNDVAHLNTNQNNFSDDMRTQEEIICSTRIDLLDDKLDVAESNENEKRARNVQPSFESKTHEMEKSQGETEIVSTKTEFNISSTEDLLQENLAIDKETERNLNPIPIQTPKQFETNTDDSQELVEVNLSQINNKNIEDGQDVMKKPSSEELASSAEVISESDIPDNASVNEGLLKAVTTQLIQDYPDLVSNLTYLQALAVNQTLLLQSFINSDNGDSCSQSVDLIYPSQKPLQMDAPTVKPCQQQVLANQPTINQDQLTINPCQQPLHTNQSTSQQPVNPPTIKQGQQPVQTNIPTINQGQQLDQQVQQTVLTNQPTLNQSEHLLQTNQTTKNPSQQPTAANQSISNQDQQPIPVLHSSRNQDQQPLHANEEQNPNMQALPQSKPGSRKARETQPPFTQDLTTQPELHTKTSDPLCNSDQNVNTVPESKSEILSPTSKQPVNMLQDPKQLPAQQYSSVLQTPHYSTSHQSSPQQSTPPKPAFLLPCPNNFSGLPTPEKSYILSPSCLLPTPQQPGYILQNAIYSPRLNNPSMISAGLRQPQMTTLPHASYKCPSPGQVTSNTGIRFPVRAPLSSSDTNIGTRLHLQYPMKTVRSIRLQAPKQTEESPTSGPMSKIDSINADSETVSNREISRKTSDDTVEKANKPKPLMSLHSDPALLEHRSNIEFLHASSVFGSQSSIASLDNEYKSGDKSKPATRTKRRKQNKTVLSDNENQLFPGLSQSQDAWDQEVDPYPETFKFNVDLKRPLNFGANSSGLSDVTTDTQASHLLSNKVKQPTKRVPSEKNTSEEKNQRPEQSKLNTEFLGRLLRHAESSNKRKDKSNRDIYGGNSEVKQELKYNEPVDEWQTVPISKKNKKSKQDSPKAPTATTSKKIPGLHSNNNSQSTFENLVNVLSTRIPNVTRPDILYVFSEIRKKRGTLKGMPLQDIVEEGRSILARKTEKQSVSGVMNACNNGGQKSALPPRFKRLLEKNSSELPVVSVNEEGELCVICCDELIMEKTKILDCGHEFHSMCISEWVYKHERTCPTCRQIALFPEEFPHLKKTSHK